MYGFIKGIITDIDVNHVIIENNNIGYLIYVPNPYHYQINDEYKIYTYQHVREDEISLYGFSSIEEKKMFLKLINVKGVGCKTALPMIALGSINGIIDAIEKENILYLKKFPKIGDKVARQIILDLKGKLVNSTDSNIKESSDELIETLKSLGYRNNDIISVIKKVDLTKSIEEQVKDSLRLMLK